MKRGDLLWLAGAMWLGLGIGLDKLALTVLGGLAFAAAAWMWGKDQRFRAALELIGTTCANYRDGWTCVDAGRTSDAEYLADRWCDQCIARSALEEGGPS